MRVFLYLSLLTICLGLMACGRSSEAPAIVKVVQANVAASEAEDLDACMATIHPEAPGREQIRATLQELFTLYDLHQTVEKITVRSVTKDEAIVDMVQTTTKIKGPDFRNNRLIITSELRKENGQWKIYGWDIKKVDYLK